MKKWFYLVRSAYTFALAAILAAGLVSCTQQTQAPTSDNSVSGSTAKTQSDNALYGSPWVSSVFAGNLPDAAPDAVDDLYLHYAYDYAAAHQDTAYASATDDTQNELQTKVTKVIKNDSFENPELEQLRIFYTQAADINAREKASADELKPYLKAILDTQSLSELEAVLLSENFPFSPWINTTVSAPNMKSTICVTVMPHMLFTDAETDAKVYQDADSEKSKAAYELMISQKRTLIESDLMLISIAENTDQATKLVDSMFELEKSYGKDEDLKTYQNAGYGAEANIVQLFTFDDLIAACPNFPIRETLAKLDEDTGEGAIIMYPEWLSSFNNVWIEDNFDLLRSMTAVKVLHECADFIAPSFYANARAALGQADLTSDELAYTACDKAETFSQLLAKTYVEQELGNETEEELEKLANDLIDSYINLVSNTPWLKANSREAIINKIDNMALNILYPDGGYFNYNELKLTPTEEGGTLLSNYLALKAYNDKLEAALVGQPARASAMWLYLKPTTQNCFYDSVSNSINVFPGYVTSAAYTKNMTPEELLAGIGFVVGHEISHAFDYSGSQFNAFGQPIAVFTDADVQEFLAIRQKIAEHYSAFKLTSDSFIDGEAVSAEATADLCGLQVTLTRAHDIKDFSFEKFFEHFARSWATIYSPIYADLLLTETHAPSNLRVNASAQMLDDFYNTYNAANGNTMYLAPENRIAMWGKLSG